MVFPYDPPYGTWKSDDPEITLDIVSKAQDASTGIYVKDGESIEVFVDFHNDPGFTIRNTDTTVYGEEGVGYIDGNRWYFIGDYEIKRDGKLYYYARMSEGLGFQDEYEEMVIIFEKIHEINETG